MPKAFIPFDEAMALHAYGHKLKKLGLIKGSRTPEEIKKQLIDPEFIGRITNLLERAL